MNKYDDNNSSDESTESDEDIDIHELCRQGTREEVDWALSRDRHKMLNIKDEYGRSALHYATTSNRMDITQLLLRRGAEIDFRDKENATPLHLTCHEGHTVMARAR